MLFSAAGRRAGSYTSFPSSRSNRRRRGMASLLAMLYLVIFSALAVGFYAQTTLSA